MFKKSVPYVQQMQETECGLCCVDMILKYYGSKVSMSYLKNDFEIGRDGMSAKDIGDMLKHYNFKVEYYRSNTEGLKKISKHPTILYWDNVHFVVLEKIVKDKYFVVDPKIGREVFNEIEFKKHYSNFVIRPIETEKFEKRMKRKEENIYYSFFLNNKLKLCKLILLSLLAYLISLLAPAILQRAIDDIVRGDISFSDQYLKIVVLIMALYATLTYMRSIRTISFSKLMDEHTYKNVIKKLYDLPYNFFLTRNSSELLYRLSLMKSNRNFLIDKLISSIFNIINLLILLVVMLSINLKIFIVVLLISILICLVIFPLQKRIMLLTRKSIAYESQLQAKEYEALTSMYAIKSIGLSDFFKSKIYKIYDFSIKSFEDKNKTDSVYSIISSIIIIFMPLIIIIIMNISKISISVGTIFFLNTILIYYFQSLGDVLGSVISFNQFKLNNERIQDIMQSDCKKKNPDLIKINKINKIEFKNVSYRYPGQKEYTIKDISFILKMTNKIGVVGKTGSGKTTLLSLMMGIIEPTEGEILINGYNISDIDIETFRKRIGYVPQESFIVSASIKDNILMERKVDEASLYNAIKQSELIEDIKKLPMKEYTLISEGGSNLSGGQRQRIAIARAILENPDLIVFDEATSSIDNHTQQKISSYISKIKCAQLLVSHRLSTVKNCDQIIVMNNGRIAERGSEVKLLQKKGIYYKLYTGEI